MQKIKYLIIGNSTAAINAVESIRILDKEADIAVVSDEPYHTYSRPLITYYLGGKIEENGIYYRPVSFYDNYKVKTFLDKAAIALDTDSKKIVLDDNTEIEFEKLLLTTGGLPFVPDISGKDLDGIFTFTTLDDCHRVRRFIEKHKARKALVIGGGLIGLKVTDALLALNIKVTIVELADRILSATFDKTASNMIEQALNRTGCSVITSNTVEEFREGEKNRIGSVILKDKTSLECDLVIIAIGVRPRIDLVRDTKIKINRGILVDSYLKTSSEDIYAAGDAIESYDFIAKTHRSIAILPNASKQGMIAGWNMAGGNRKYSGCIPMNSVELAGIPTISVGITDPSLLTDEERKTGIEVLQELNREDCIYKKIILEDKKIIGTIFVGKIERAGIYTGLIKDKLDVSSFKGHLLKEDFGLISLPREYRKHLVTGLGIEV